MADYNKLRHENDLGYKRARAYFNRKNKAERRERELDSKSEDEDEALYAARRDPSPYDDELGVTRMMHANVHTNIDIAESLAWIAASLSHIAQRT